MNNPAVDELRSRFTPMPADLHIGFCIFATVVFLIIFMRRKTVSSLIWALICDATVILQFFNDSTTAAAVGICEIVLFAILMWVSLGERRERKLREAEEAAIAEIENESELDSSDEPDNLEDIAKLVRSERSKLADNDDDIIKNAFEDN